MDKSDLTDEQLRYFQAIFDYLEEHGTLPTFAEKSAVSTPLQISTR
jgi:hypothetical protein